MSREQRDVPLITALGAKIEWLEADNARLTRERDALQAEVKRLTNELYVDGIAPVPALEHKP